MNKADLLNAIHSTPHLVPSDYAIKLGTGTPTINKLLLNDPDCQLLVYAGLVSAVAGERLSAWALDGNGQKIPAIGYAERTLAKPQALMVLPPLPKPSGVEPYDRLSQQINEIDHEYAMTGSIKKKNELNQKRAEAQDSQSLLMDFMRRLDAAKNDTLKAKDEALKAKDEALKAKDETLNAKDEAIDLLRPDDGVTPKRPNGHASSSI